MDKYDELNEWRKFAESGRIEDYILYRKYTRREGPPHAHEHGRADNKGEQHGGK